MVAAQVRTVGACKNGRNQWENHARPSRGDAHADIADGGRLTTRPRPQIRLLFTATRCFNADPLRFTVAFVTGGRK